MAAVTGLRLGRSKGSSVVPGIRKDPLWIKVLIISLVMVFFSFLILLPLALVFTEALRKGWEVYTTALVENAAFEAIKLTLFTTLVVVPLNALFGLFAAWAIAKFSFKGKTLLTSLIDLPFSVSPVIAGLIFILLLGARTPLGSWFRDFGLQIVFAPPGIILATLFVTFPFVARELIPLMQSLGKEEEEAALTLGATPWQMFFRVTLPNIKWGLIYGLILCNARAMGEFGAVSVVSGHIRGQTNTIPLHVEILYNEYSFAASFAVASLLVFMALITILVKNWVEHQYGKEI